MAAYKLYNPQKRTPHPHPHTPTHTLLNKLARHTPTQFDLYGFSICALLLSAFYSLLSLRFSFFFFVGLVWFGFPFRFISSVPFLVLFFFVHCLFLVCLCCICHCINFWYLRQFHSKLSAGHSRLFLMHPATRATKQYAAIGWQQRGGGSQGVRGDI